MTPITLISYNRFMKRYIKDTFFTLLQAVIILALLLAASYYFNHPLPKEISIAWVYLILLSAVVIIKRQLLKLRRFRILHFSIKKIDKMAGKDFEKYLKVRFERLGFHVTLTKDSGDYGADLILKDRHSNIVVQAKRYHSYVGIKAVQEVIGSMAYYKASKGLVVTNSYYTRNARELAFANDVILWDRDVLIHMIANENMSGYLAELREY